MNGGKSTRSNIQGNVRKLLIDSYVDMPDVKITFYTDIGETMLIVEGIKAGNNIYYPYNKLDELYSDYFCIQGQMYFIIEGLGESEKVKNVVVFYEQ